jgi:hypothetical protein
MRPKEREYENRAGEQAAGPCLSFLYSPRPFPMCCWLMYPCAGMDFSSLVFHNCIVYSVWRSLIVLIEKRYVLFKQREQLKLGSRVWSVILNYSRTFPQKTDKKHFIYILPFVFVFWDWIFIS